jgi:lipopolysaccharide/colanic/teichoic acid biosynthesis glycosyltransferase
MASNTYISELHDKTSSSPVSKQFELTKRTTPPPVVVLLQFLADACTCMAVMFVCCLLPWTGADAALSLPHKLLFSSMVGLCAGTVLLRLHGRAPETDSCPISGTAIALRRSMQAILLLLLPGSLILRSDFPRFSAAVTALFMPFALALQRYLITILQQGDDYSGNCLERVVIYGPGSVGTGNARKILSSLRPVAHPVAFLDDSLGIVNGTREVLGVPVSCIFPTAEFLRGLQCDALVIATGGSSSKRIAEAVRAAREAGARIAEASEWHRESQSKNEDLSTETIDDNSFYGTSWYYSCCKRMLDLVVSSLLLVLLAPLYLAIAFLVRLNSNGSALFIQERVGIGGTLFKMYKFRSMSCDAEKYEYSPATPQDPRITSVGRWLRRTGLDELPQLLNVFLGDMSLVGPRPEMPFIVRDYDDIQRSRLHVIPGITGLWQLSPDRAYPIHENLHHDLTYVRARSLSLDVAILIHTLLFGMRGGI